jgi:uncharacterized integral membrane protein
MIVFIFFTLGIVLGGLTVVFALHNVAPVTVSFFAWQIQGSLAFVLLMAAFMGALAAYLTVLPQSILSYFKYRKLRKQNAQLTEDLQKQKELTHFARKTNPTQEDIAHIEQGAILDNRA